MYLLSPALEFSKDTMARFPKPYSIHKELKSYRLDLTKQLESGMWSHSNACKFLKVMRIKFSLASSTTREILLLQAQKTIPVKCGETSKLGKSE